MADVSEADLDECTGVLMTVPLPIARRLETFLLANGVACKIRRNDAVTPEQLAEDAVRSATPQAAKMLDSPLVGRLLRTRIKHAAKAEIEVTGSELLPAYDVLVRPETLPAKVAPEETPSTRDEPKQSTDPWARPGEVSTAAAPANVGAGMSAITALPWDAAWSLAGRLQDADIPATVLPVADGPGASGSIGEAMFQVVVQSADAARAQELASGAVQGSPPSEQ
jgi:hypothetical protein